MAKKRFLKKDIYYLVSNIINDCYNFEYLFPGKETKEIESIISEITDMNNLLINKINQKVDKLDKRNVKKHFNSISNELISKSNEAYFRLSKLIEKVERK